MGENGVFQTYGLHFPFYRPGRAYQQGRCKWIKTFSFGSRIIPTFSEAKPLNGFKLFLEARVLKGTIQHPNGQKLRFRLARRSKYKTGVCAHPANSVGWEI